jgi:excinuclease UvrABC ATPase subunit
MVDAGETLGGVGYGTHVIAGSDQVIDVGPGAGEEGGRVVAAGPPAVVAAPRRAARRLVSRWCRGDGMERKETRGAWA